MTLTDDDLASLAAYADEPEAIAEREAAFWARPAHARVREFARARRTPPWSTFGWVLVRVAASVPAHVVLPPLIGGVGNLNLFVGIVANSGGGKGSSQRAAEGAVRLSGGLPFPPPVTPGTGEGMTTAFVRRSAEDPSGVELHTESVVFDVAEVSGLAAVSGRTGSTLLSHMCQAWSGERLGFQYADAAKRLPVAANSYRATLVVGIQPLRAGVLLDDEDGGTPQRFVWLPGTDPDIPDVAPPVPEPWHWTMPGLDVLPREKSTGYRVIEVCDEARRTIDTEHVKRQRGDGDALDGHALYTRLKVAAVLALLDGRGDVNDEDWYLAGTLMLVSDRVREDVLAIRKTNRVRAEINRKIAQERAAEVVQDDTYRRGVHDARASIIRLISEEPRAKSKVRKGLSKRLREYFDDALDGLVDEGSVKVDEGRYNGQEGTWLRTSG